jgi:glutamate-1-semialdehyde 2,1-aminomutase
VAADGRAAALLESAYQELREARPRGASHYDRACQFLPRGTTRARFWEPMPIYVERAQGAYLEDVDGNRYIDCSLGQGALLLGNNHPIVVDALRSQLSRGTHFGPTNELAIELAETITGAVPGAERVSFTNSGTEATLAALRLARAATGRRKVAKVEGGWHGANEYVLFSFTSLSGPHQRPEANAASAGVWEGAGEDVVVLPFNDEAAPALVREEGHELACVIVEPVLGGAGCLPASPAYLESLRRACDDTGALLVFDEVVTGFRLGPRSAGGRYGVTADVTTLGKAIGGGQPVGAVCGRADLLELLVAPKAGLDSSAVVGAGGTFAANPMTVAAGFAQLSELLSNPAHYERLERLGESMRQGLSEMFARRGTPAHVTGVGSMFRVHLTPRMPETPRDLLQTNELATHLLRVYLELEGLVRGMGFVSTAHEDADVDRSIAAYEAAIVRLESEGCLQIEAK